MAVRSVVAAGVLAALLALTGCRDKKPGEVQAQVRSGGTFRLVYQSAPESLDPMRILFVPDWTIASFVYEGLAGFGQQPGEVRPLLAERWSESEGGRRWVFQLREDAYFHDDPCFPGGRGRKLTAQDVQYSFERIARAWAECENWYLLAGKIEGIDDFAHQRAPSISGIRVLDERRVEFRLLKPYATFLKILSSPTTYIVAREAVEFYRSNFGRMPVGTGPFRLVRWKPVEQALLARNQRYWRRDAAGAPLPYLESIDIRFRADQTESTRLAGLQQGESYLTEVEEKLYQSLKDGVLDARRYPLAGVLPTSAVRFLGFSLDSQSPFARHAELRRAAAMAFDRERLVRQFPGVSVLLANGLVPPGWLVGPREWYRHDPQAAHALVEPFRSELEGSTLTLAANFAAEELSILSQSLAGLGVRSRVRVQAANYYQFITAERPDLFRVSFVPSFFDPEDYYCLFSSRSSNDVNLMRYRNPEYDRVLESAMVERDEVRRNRLFEQLEQLLRRDVPALYLSHGSPTYVVAAPAVRGARLSFMVPDLSEAWLAEEHAGAAQPQK